MRGSGGDATIEERVSWSRTTALPVDIVSASLAREFVGKHLGEHGSPHLVEDVQLVVSELATRMLWSMRGHRLW